MNSGRQYSQIVKASSIVGGAQVIDMMISLVRIKLVALLIGPTGIGIVGLYQSITGIAAIVAGMGINRSGVRDVAEAVGSGDDLRVSETIITLRRVCWLTGILGCLILYVSADFLSRRTFGSSEYSWAIQLLGLTILMGNIAGGQKAIIQGTRRIGDLARIQIVSGVLSTVVCVAWYVTLGLRGIVPALLSVSAISLIVSTWFARRVPFERVVLTWRETFSRTGGLFSLGLAFLWSGLLASLVAYLTRMLIAHDLSVEAVGIYTAAFTLSGLFVQFVLQAMSADYYPRLTAVSHDHRKMNRLINQQTEIGLLLAFPGLIATLALAPWVIQIFYSAEFAPASVLLKWFVLGCIGRVISWPLGFTFLAKGQGFLFATVQTTFNALHFSFIWLGLVYYGLVGVAIAFAATYLFHVGGLLILTKWQTNFRWNLPVMKLLFWMVPLATVVFLLDLFLPSLVASLLGGLVAAASSILCLRYLVVCVGINHSISLAIMRVPLGIWILRGLR